MYVEIAIFILFISGLDMFISLRLHKKYGNSLFLYERPAFDIITLPIYNLLLFIIINHIFKEEHIGNYIYAMIFHFSVYSVCWLLLYIVKPNTTLAYDALKPFNIIFVFILYYGYKLYKFIEKVNDYLYDIFYGKDN